MPRRRSARSRSGWTSTLKGIDRGLDDSGMTQHGKRADSITGRCSRPGSDTHSPDQSAPRSGCHSTDRATAPRGATRPRSVARQMLRLGFFCVLVTGCASRAGVAVSVNDIEVGARDLFCRSVSVPAISSFTAEPGVEEVGVVVHLMMATIDDNARKAGDWKLAPKGRAIATNWLADRPGSTSHLSLFWGRDGEVNRIWACHGIRVVVTRVEECQYDPGRLRLDGQRVDSIFIPETRVPWGAPLFRSINRIFSTREPHRLHVLLWWSVSEGEFGNDTLVRGYSRSAGRGGPAVWVSTYKCVTPQTAGYEASCARLLAHEVGHALGLHHVDAPDSNLMYWRHTGEVLTGWQARQARSEAMRQFR